MKPWPEIPLAEIAKPISRTVEVIPGQSYRTIGVKWWGEGAYERETIDGSRTAAKTLSLVRQGDLIINKIWVRHGSTAIAGPDVDGCAASGEFPTFHLDESRVVPRWLHWQTKTRGFWAKCDALSRGTSGKNRIKPELFLTIRVPLPPLAEQRRVVARIEELAAQIHEARTLRHQAADEAEALFEASVSNRLSELSNHPTQKLAALTTKIGSGSTPSGGRAGYPNSGVPFVRSMNVRMRRFQWDDIAFISADIHKQMSGTQVRRGDVLLNITGASIGRVACAPDDLQEANVNQHVAIIRPALEIEAKFLMYWLSQPRIQEFINDEQKGATRQGFTKAQIEAFDVPLVSVAEQRRIVSELDALQVEVDTLKCLQAETAAELDALLPSVLDIAFKGEL